MTDTNIDTIVAFPCHIYSLEKPEFIDSVRTVALDFLKDVETTDDLYPVKMSGPMEMDHRLQDFASFTAITAGNILTDQGYMTNGLGAYFDSMWCQEHHFRSGMDQHTHPESLIVGFYFLDVPEKSSQINFFDPRPGKVACPIGEASQRNVTYASNGFYMKPQPGQLIMTNSWLPHSFTRHSNTEPLRFIHFNISLTHHNVPPAEVI